MNQILLPRESLLPPEAAIGRSGEPIAESNHCTIEPPAMNSTEDSELYLFSSTLTTEAQSMETTNECQLPRIYIGDSPTLLDRMFWGINFIRKSSSQQRTSDYDSMIVFRFRILSLDCCSTEGLRRPGSQHVPVYFAPNPTRDQVASGTAAIGLWYGALRYHGYDIPSS